MKTTFLGYPRPAGQVGSRNYLLVMATCECSYQEAQRMAQAVPGAVAVGQMHGCRENDMIIRQMTGVALNPNVGAVLLVGLGCENISVDQIGAGIAPSGKPMADVVIQRDGGSLKAIEKGTRLARDLMAGLSRQQPEPVGLEHLVVGLQCGGSDATSGLAANPAVGEAADRLVDAGAIVMASEPHEMIGAEEIMARRAASEEVAADLLRIIHEREVLAKASGLPSRHMSQGNMDGGLTTLEEKSLGAVRKTGTRPIHGVLRNDRNDLDRPTEPGLYIQDGQEMDMPSTTHMVAAGAQVILFTTGRGSTTGHAIAPVIKVTGNPQTYVNMPDNMDVDAGRILTGQTSIAEIGAEIYDLVLRVASGEKTKAELLGFQDFVLYNLDPILANVMRGCPSP